MAPPPLFYPQKELPVLLQTPHFLVINKPTGLAVHPSSHTKDCVEACLTPQKRGGPWLVHRLDTDTSGCLLIARRKTALIQAQQAFASRRTRKCYWAIVQGVPKRTKGRITTPLRRTLHKGQWHMETTDTAADGAQQADTQWHLLGHNKTFSWLELILHTGRTHQARLHCQALGTPIIGDKLYGNKINSIQTPSAPMQLLARSLSLTLSNETIEAQAPAPPFMQAFINHIR